MQNSNGDDSTSNSFSNQKRIERMFGKIRRLPKKSCLLANFEDSLYENSDEKKDPTQVLEAKKNGQELVKVIGLEPHKLFEKMPKYKI